MALDVSPRQTDSWLPHDEANCTNSSVEQGNSEEVFLQEFKDICNYMYIYTDYLCIFFQGVDILFLKGFLSFLFSAPKIGRKKKWMRACRTPLPGCPGFERMSFGLWSTLNLCVVEFMESCRVAFTPYLCTIAIHASYSCEDTT